VRIAPPLNIPRETLQQAVSEIRSVFAELASGDAASVSAAGTRAAPADAIAAR
jgi:hypothetical protein